MSRPVINATVQRRTLDESIDGTTSKPEKTRRTTSWYGACFTEGMRRLLLPLFLVLALAGGDTARADEPTGDITLAEIVPMLEGSAHGAIVIAEAPAPGTTRVVRRSQVLAALRAAGVNPRGLAIPRSTRIERRPTELDGDALQARIGPAVARAFAPCELEGLRLPSHLSLPRGTIDVRVEGEAPVRSSRVSGVAVVSAGGVERRLAFTARAECPPPAVSSGASLRLIVRVGNVVASAPGQASQNGRIGQVIRVRNLSTQRALMARIIDAENAEIVR